MTGKVLAVLGFHSIGAPSPGGWSTWFYIPTATFSTQIEDLLDMEWTIISYETLMRGIDDPDTLPDQAAVLTFDDGYRSMVSVTLPVLRQFEAPGILFVPTDYIGGTNSFEPDGWAPREPICDWDDLRALIAGGVAVQSHGAAHRSWSGLSPSERQQDAERSRNVLERGLGLPVHLFSFPYGDAGINRQETDQTLQGAGYRAACLYDGSVNQVGSPAPGHRYRLSRLRMGPDTDLKRILADMPESAL